MKDDLPTVKVCIHRRCKERGSCALYEKLRYELYGEAEVISTPECFDACEDGPNVSVNGELLHHVSLDRSVEVVHQALAHPSLKSDGRGTRPITELDQAIDELTQP